MDETCCMATFILQTGTVIQMLMTASEQISTGLDSRNHDNLGLEDAQTLIRVMCHKKDRQASKFLKRQYQLPPSSGDCFHVTFFPFVDFCYCMGLEDARTF